MKIAVFLSHPIQHFSPLWRELSKGPDVYLKVFYYYEDGIRSSFDQDFGVDVCWDVDLLAGYEHEFLGTRRWPKEGMLPKMMVPSKGIPEVLGRGWDVVYIAGYAHVNSWLIISICRRLNIPVLYHSDTNILLAKQRSAVRLAFKRLVITRFFQQISVFLAVGDRNRDYLLHYGAPADRIHWCAIPVDIDRFRHAARDLDESERAKLRVAYDIRPDDFVVGFCGKLRDIKRPQDLAQAVRAVSAKRIVGLFIGSGMMDRTIREVGGDRVRITGFVNQSTIPKVFSLCDVTVMPSMGDNHPLVVTESQCLGIPVILSDKCGCSGPHDVFRDGESGILYPCGDIGALANAIECLMSNSSLREKMGHRAKDLAETQGPGSSAAGFLTAAHAAVANPLARKRGPVPPCRAIPSIHVRAPDPYWSTTNEEILPERTRCVHFLRIQKGGTLSIERLFGTVRTAIPRDVNIIVAVSRFPSRGIWRRLYNTVEAAFRQGDVNHITGDTHYLAVLLRKKKTVLTIHDLGTVYRLGGLRQKTFLFLWYWLPIRRSAIVTVISEATKRELLHYVKVAPRKIRVVPNCVSEAFRPAPREFHDARPTILQVGTKQNKNLERVGKALRGLPCRLRVIGKLTEGQAAVLRQNQIEYSSASNLPDAEVVEEYRRCDMVVFVSTYEGFGLPILEAQATGRPVVTSSVSSMPEVAGNAACLVNPLDVESIRAGILKVIADPQYRNELVQRGMENVKRFQPGAIAARYAEIYRELAGRMSAHGRDKQSQHTAMAGQGSLHDR